ncbi:hypothetical protein PAPHI01_1089 [Pancytospora philotis]|nr:hypothetical protein PAPHI01_1089 [Pancytospora philotis]
MYILNNCEEDVTFRVTKKNGIASLHAEDAPVTYASTEARHPVQYFCVPAAPAGGPVSIRPQEMVSAKFFSVELVLERAAAPAEQEATYDALINSFGDKNSKKRMKKREAGEASRARAVQFNIGNQLLPDFNRDASDVRDVYRLELLFGDAVLEGLEHADVEPDDMCYAARVNRPDGDGRVLMVAVDCLYKILELKSPKPENIPGCYRFFYDEIKHEMTRGRMSSLQRDKLTVKLYIVLLMINNYSLQYAQLPKFDAPRSKVVGMLKAIGCTVKPSGLVTLANFPQETVAA